MYSAPSMPKARAGFIVTPVRHVETMGHLEDEELYCLWRMGVRALRSEGPQPVSMVVNHGSYRNLPHLHLKIWVDDGAHRQARLKWSDDKKRVWARLERLTSSSLPKKRALCRGFESQLSVVEHPFSREDFLISSKMKCTTFILNHGHCCWRAVPKLAGDKQFDRFLLFPFVASFKIFLNLCANKKSLSLFLAGLLRCGKSCRLRWTNYLRPDLKRGVLSESEEQLIIDLHSQLGNR